MSGYEETPAELIADFQSTYTYNLTFLGAVAWLVWEYVITFDREVSLVWSRKVNSAAVVFLLNRYIMLIQFAVQLPLSFTISDESVAPYFVWAAFSALRAYAMSNRTWPVAIIVFLLSITPAGYNIYNFAQLVPINLPAPIFCIPSFPGITPTFIDHWTTATRICLIVADALVICVTWGRTYRFRVSAVEANVKTSLLTLLLRDGTIYFIILLILNILHIIVRITAQANFITTFEEPLTSILISRFIMNLRELDYTPRGLQTVSDADGGPAETTLDFADRSHFTTHTQSAGTSAGSGTETHHTATMMRFIDGFQTPDVLYGEDGKQAADLEKGEDTATDVLVEWVNADSLLRGPRVEGMGREDMRAAPPN
ncbi:hypothetical protein C8Q79DRAFT_926268 [Trametes meyenii]|nr:hypothetical protein C8Q79DRAFT_926268 [Trametes meyenii]